MLTANGDRMQRLQYPSAKAAMNALTMKMDIVPVVNEKLNDKMHWQELDCNARLTCVTVTQLKNCATG
jgi:glutamate 5-kinase